MHPHDHIQDIVVVAFLNPLQKLNGDPLLFALHKGSHDFASAVFIEALGLEAVDILFIVFVGPLTSRFLGDGRVPSVAPVNTEGFNDECWQLGGPASLRLAPNKADALGFSAVAGLGIGTVSINIVVERQFLASLDLALYKDTHAKLVTDYPFVDVTVGITRVVAKAP